MSHQKRRAHTGDIQAQGSGDILVEIKVPSPLRQSDRKAGRGSSEHGGCPASVGHLLGLGNTEEEYRVLVLGCKARGRQRDGAFNHSTGRGWVKGKAGQYADALRKRSSVVAAIIEAFGGISPHYRAFIRRLADRSKGANATDRTRYGRLRGSTRSFMRHHIQHVVKAAVVGDSEAILRQITFLKQRVFGTAQAAAGGSARDATA